jgi:hypothetical protein
MASSLNYCARDCPPLDEAAVANFATRHNLNKVIGLQYRYVKSSRPLALVTTSAPVCTSFACAAEKLLVLRVN